MKNNFDDLGFQAFDDLGFQAEAPIAETPDDSSVSKTESFLRGAADAGLLGFADEAAGAAGAISDVASPNYSIGDILDRYAANRDESRTNFKAAQEANPLTYLGGNLAGGLGTAFVPGMAPATLGKIAGLGAVAGVGSSEENNLTGMAKDAATGAAIGGVTHGLLRGAGSLANEVADSYPGQIVKRQFGLGKEGISTSSAVGRDAAKDEAEKLGNDLLDRINKRVSTAGNEKRAALAKGTTDVSEELKKLSDELGVGVGELKDVSGGSGKDIQELLRSSNKMKRTAEGRPSEVFEDYATQSGKADLLANAPKGNYAKDVDDIIRSFSDLTAYGDNSLGTPEGQKKAVDMLGKLKTLMTDKSLPPEEAAKVLKMNKEIHKFLEAKKLILGIDDKALGGLDEVIHEGKVQDFFAKQGKSGPVGIKAGMKSDYLKQSLGTVDPAFAEQAGQDIDKAGRIYQGLRDVEAKPITGIFDLLSGAQVLAKGSNKLGVGYNKAASVVKMSSDALSQASDAVLSSALPAGVKTKLSNVFKTMSEADEQKKAALIYGLQQNPEYKEALKSLGIDFNSKEGK